MKFKVTNSSLLYVVSIQDILRKEEQNKPMKHRVKN